MNCLTKLFQQKRRRIGYIQAFSGPMISKRDSSEMNSMETVKVLNIDIQNITRQELLENLKEGVLVTPNLDHLIKLQKDKEFYDVYQKSEWVVCDSKILCLFGKLLKTPIKEAIPGSSFFTSYYMYHKDDADCKIFLLGAKEGIAAKAMEHINEKVGRQTMVRAAMLLGSPMGICPARVKKLQISTNICGEKLKNCGYQFKWSFEEALKDWFEDNDRKGLL